MARKRKVESSSTAIVDESDKVLYAVFRNSANELSQLYSQAISHNKFSFEAGQRHALDNRDKLQMSGAIMGTLVDSYEKLSNWMAMKQQGGITVTASEISAYLQNELNSISNTSHDSHGSRDEVNLFLSAPAIQSQAKNRNMCFPFDLEMDTTPEESGH